MAALRLTQSRYLVEGIDSTSCAAKIEAAVRRLPGVLEVSVSLPAGTITVSHVDNEFASIAVERQVRALGHKVVPIVLV